MENKSMKKNLIIVAVVIPIIISLLILTVIWDGINSYRFVTYVNWNILLPKPDNMDIVYTFNYREGEDFVIWYYEDVKKVIEKENLNKIGKENKIKVASTLERYYNKLDNKEKEKFNKNTSIEYLSNPDNYYIYLGEDERYLLMITCDNKIYSFHANY